MIEEYKAVLDGAKPGYGADVVLAPGEDKHHVRQNLKAAADELKQVVEFRPIKDKSRLHIRFITAEEYAAKPKRTGRPRKNISAALTEQPTVVDTSSNEVPQKQTRKSRPKAS